MTSQPSTPFTIVSESVEDIDKLGDEWRELESRSDSHSFFLSWHWIGNWLRCIPPHIKPMVLRITGEGVLVGLAILCKGNGPILRFARLNQMLINVAGDPELDDIAIEYNGFLSASGMDDTITRAGLEWLMRSYVPNQTLRLDGINEHLSEIAIATALPLGRQPHLLSFHPAPFVDLVAIRDSGKDYLSHLSRNTRQSLKRTIRHFENIGPLEYHVASTLDEALAIYADLEVAHQANWHARGKPGAFALAVLKRFHLALISSAFAGGYIEIARISAGGQPIGYLYNFIWRGTVLAYQSGFCYSEGETSRPGYVSHYMAIISALSKNRNIYDFMAGQRQHKSSLSTGTQNLSWLQLRAQTPLVRLENVLRKLRDAVLK